MFLTFEFLHSAATISGETFDWKTEPKDDGFIVPVFPLMREFLLDEEWDAAKRAHETMLQDMSDYDGILAQYDGAILTIVPFLWDDDKDSAIEAAFLYDGWYVIDVLQNSHISTRG